MLVKDVSNNVASAQNTNNRQNLQQDDFLNMLVMQLRYQDPMDPDNSGDLTQQMSMFNMMDQGAKTNEYLAQLLEMQRTDSQQPKMQNMVNYIDKAVEIDSSQIILAEGQAECNFTLPQSANMVQLMISNNYGEEVYNTKLYDLQAPGKTNKFTWDGCDNNGQNLRSGQYNFSLITHDQFDREMKIMPQVSGVVDTITKVNGSPYLQVGEMLVDPQQVISIKKVI